MDMKQKGANNSNFIITYEGDKMIVSEIGYSTDVFRIVDSVPRPYTVWNIGSHMPKGYLPLCRLLPNQPFPGGRAIDADQLLAIIADGADVIMKAVAYGPDTPEEMESYIKDNQDAKKGTYLYERVECVKKALQYMRQIKWY